VAKHLSETRTETLILDLLNIQGWATGRPPISLLSSPTLVDLAPVVPRPEVLADKADLINRLLREAHVKDEYRAAYVGAMMLALWQSRGSLSKDPDFVLRDINSACEDAYTKGGKPELAKSLHIDEANSRLAASTWQILATLEKLNVVTASFAHDYLGQLYEAFFRYTGGNTIGQYFTPANMILRGDGITGIRKADCFSTDDYPVGKCQVALMNPPFPHRKTDVPPQKFIERALEALEQRGKLAVILPTSLIVKPETGEWRSDVLSRHSLLAVCELPDELFQPYASSTTSIVVFEKGIPHNSRRETIFTRLHYDGFALRKGTRVLRLDGKNQISEAVDAILNKRNLPGFSGVAALPGDAEWAPGAYIPSALPTEEELKVSIDELLRRLASFYARYAPQVAAQRSGLKSGELNAQHSHEK
jgi:N-6 DNA Methylase